MTLHVDTLDYILIDHVQTGLRILQTQTRTEVYKPNIKGLNKYFTMPFNRYNLTVEKSEHCKIGVAGRLQFEKDIKDLLTKGID